MAAGAVHPPLDSLTQDEILTERTALASSFQPFSRPHSASISSVHFAEHLPRHRQSVISLRSLSQLTQPSQHPLNDVPSPLRRSVTDISPKDRSTSTFSPSATIPESIRITPATTSRTSSQDRDRHVHNRSTSQGRPKTLLAHGKRPSLTTGGYESSSDEVTSSSSHSRPSHPRNGQPISQSFSAGPSVRTRSELGRDRAQSLKSPATHLERNESPDGEDEAGQRRKRHASRRLEEVMSVPRNEGRQLRTASLRSPTSSLPIPSPMRVTSQAFIPSRPPLPRDEIFPAESSSAPSMSTSEYSHPEAPSKPVSGRVREVEKVRDKSGLGSFGSSRKGKDKERRVGGLAASLGLDRGADAVALSPDQINSLLGDSDIASALRIMQNSHLTPRVLIDRFNPSPSPSSSSTRPGLNPLYIEPFIPTAPPPLVSENGHLTRDRTISVTSTVASPPRPSWSPRKRVASDTGNPRERPMLDRRRRASSRVTVGDGEGGHIPFTHHVREITVEEDAQSGGTDTEVGYDPLVTATPPTPTAPSGVDTIGGQLKPEKRNRLNQLFHLKRRKSVETLLPVPVQSLKRDASLTRPEASSEPQKAAEKQKSVRDAEMKRKEQERHEAEMAQERRFRALTQVAAHPDAEQMAYRASSHLRAYYTYIYDGIEDPPRMNPLAILRWHHRTDEQVEAKRVWEQESKKPMGNGWNGAIHSSPGSLGSSAKVGDQPSGESMRSRMKDGPDKSHEKGKGWKYTIEDITAYNDAEGVVNYFIPPRPAFRPDSAEGLTVPDQGVIPDERGSSVAISEKKDEQISQNRIMSASTASLVDGDRASVTSRNASMVTLSRTASIENGRARHREHSLTHRTHQSLSALGHGAIGHALKHPFEKIARKRHVHHEDQEDSFEESPLPNEQPNPLPPHHRFPTSIHRTSRNTSAPTPVSRPPTQQRRFRRDARDADFTDEERRNGNGDVESHHIRKLFLKGQRALPFEEWRNGGSRKEDRIVTAGVPPGVDRQAELQALEKALTREAAFRERQAEVDRRTQGEVEARERLEQLEKEIYAERLDIVEAARKRLDRVVGDIALMDDGVRQYITQVQQIKTTTLVSAEVETTWPGIDALQFEFAQPRRKNTSSDMQKGEESDILGPLRQYDSPSGSDTRKPVRQSSLPTRPRGTLPPSTMRPALLGNSWPRRAMLDPSGTSRVDPISLIDLTLAQARSAYTAMTQSRGTTHAQLQTLINQIDLFVKQKDLVKEYIKETKRIHDNLRIAKSALEVEIRGNYATRIARVQDSLSDSAIKQVASPLFKLVYGCLKVAQYLQARCGERKGFGWWMWVFVGLSGVGAVLGMTAAWWLHAGPGM